MLANLRETVRSLPAAANKVRSSLYESEDGIDAGIASIARLHLTMIEARIDANLAAIVGQAALSRTSRAQALLISAREELVGAHVELAEMQAQFRIRMDEGDTNITGPLKPPLPPSGITAEPPRLVA